MVSPVLSNIYLDQLDNYVERGLIPQHTRGARRKTSPQYRKLADRRRAALHDDDQGQARELVKQMRALPYGDPMDPGYRRLFYIRYADLCRARHKSAYADSPVMPRGTAQVLVSAVDGEIRSA